MEKVIENGFSKVDWIKELVSAEQKAEDTGIIDLNPQIDQQRILAQDALHFLLNLKVEFYDAANIFNELKSSPVGRLKVYGIAHTHADFMLFRNGYKMLFMLKSPGLISIKMNFVGASTLPTNSDLNSNNLIAESHLEAQLGPFNEVIWTFQNRTFSVNNLVRHYLSLFLKESMTQ